MAIARRDSSAAVTRLQRSLDKQPVAFLQLRITSLERGGRGCQWSGVRGGRCGPPRYSDYIVARILRPDREAAPRLARKRLELARGRLVRRGLRRWRLAEALVAGGRSAGAAVAARPARPVGLRAEDAQRPRPRRARWGSPRRARGAPAARPRLHESGDLVADETNGGNEIDSVVPTG